MNSQSSFATTVEQVKQFALAEIQREAAGKQLFYHSTDHAIAVLARSRAIFAAIAPYWETLMADQKPAISPERARLLLELCAISHDMVQVFSPEPAASAGPRQRELGVSEKATIHKLCLQIKLTNRKLSAQGQGLDTLFLDTDVAIIQAAIEATVCHYDAGDESIFQPALYQSRPKGFPIAQIVALADLGSLGMEGIDVFLREGCLIFVEENPELLPLIRQFCAAPSSLGTDAQETLRQRLLKRAKFQLNFAHSRLTRFPCEVACFPPAAIAKLKTEVFSYLRPDTLAAVTAQTPTDEQTPLAELIHFFQFEQLLAITPA